MTVEGVMGGVLPRPGRWLRGVTPRRGLPPATAAPTDGNGTVPGGAKREQRVF